MTVSSISDRLVVFALALILAGAAPAIRSLAQDITGGSSSELASAADVESRSGRGVFTTPKSVAHHARKLEKKTVERTTVARTQRQTGGQTGTGGGRQTSGGRETTSSRRETTSGGRETTSSGRETTSGGRETTTGGARGNTDLGSTPPLGGAPRRVAGAEELNKQGDEAFDAGQYDKAVELYQKAIKQKPTYPEAYLNLSEAYFNLGKFNEALEAAKTATEQKADWAGAYLALGNAYLKLDRS
ncbi:MAG TPA: tetratricopeptide repeat protein, partial [Pyrinomonadaceae bacterium]|nr:tetratricopeptide repeat protein [Pyrinomonadaceae bacterium]